VCVCVGVSVCGCVGVQVRFRVSLLESQWQRKVQQERSMAFLMLTHQRLGKASIWSVLEPGYLLKLSLLALLVQKYKY
jgi:hypothetical protein